MVFPLFFRCFPVNWRRSVVSCFSSPSHNTCQPCTNNPTSRSSRRTCCACLLSHEPLSTQSSLCSMNHKVKKTLADLHRFLFLSYFSLSPPFSSKPFQVRSCLDWTHSTKSCGSSFWRRCFWACPVSTHGVMRWCCSSMSSMARCYCIQRTAPSSGSTQLLPSTLLCILTISSPWVVISGSYQRCCRYTYYSYKKKYMNPLTYLDFCINWS